MVYVLLPPGLFCTAVNPLTVLVESASEGAVEVTLPETLTLCGLANPPPEWVIVPETGPAEPAAASLTWMLALLTDPEVGESVTDDPNEMLSVLTSKPADPETVMLPVRFAPETE
jgi:hypothetical protein